MSLSCPDADSYRVGWICALQIEYVAACELLDQEFRTPVLHSNDDSNIYTCGRIGDFKVVVACLPKGRYGLTSAATVAQDLRHSFPAIKFGLLVGIGGGAPSKKHDIRLGDVVVSVPTGRTGGVLHYEFGKTIQNKAFTPLGHLNAPPRFLLTAVQQLDAIHQRKGHHLDHAVNQMIQRNPRIRRTFERPPNDEDTLFVPQYQHEVENIDCKGCCNATASTTISRLDREREVDDSNLIRIHYGLIASADRLMKDATVRDHLAAAEGVLCFEMEAAGLMDNFPCLVIRGISDYSDTHKNDKWQGYAAATAAAYAKELLTIIPAREPGLKAPSVPRSWTCSPSLERESGHGQVGVGGSWNRTESRRLSSAVQSNLSMDSPLIDVGDFQRGDAESHGQQSRRQSLLPNSPDRFNQSDKDRILSILKGMGIQANASLPLAFVKALHNPLSGLIERHLPRSGNPQFVVGPLMFPEVLNARTNIPIDRLTETMAPAFIRNAEAIPMNKYKRTAAKPCAGKVAITWGMAIFTPEISDRTFFDYIYSRYCSNFIKKVSLWAHSDNSVKVFVDAFCDQLGGSIPKWDADQFLSSKMLHSLVEILERKGASSWVSIDGYPTKTLSNSEAFLAPLSESSRTNPGESQTQSFSSPNPHSHQSRPSCDFLDGQRRSSPGAAQLAPVENDISAISARCYPCPWPQCNTSFGQLSDCMKHVQLRHIEWPSHVDISQRESNDG